MFEMFAKYMSQVEAVMLGALATGFVTWIITVQKREGTIKRAVKSMLKYNIVRAYEDAQHFGDITSYMRSTVHEMNEQYMDLKGNSFVGSLVKEIDQMDIRDMEKTCVKVKKGQVK